MKASPNLPEKKPPAPSVKVRKGSDQQNIAGQGAEPPSRRGRYSAMTRRPVPGWFVVPAQPVRRDRPPAGRGWVHEIKHDGYRMLVRRDGAVVRIYSRNAINWTDRFSTIASVAATFEAHSFTIDGEAVVIGPDGVAQFDELRQRNGARRAILYGFDLIELNGVDLRRRPLLERKTALADLLGGTKAGIMLNDHITADGDMVFAHACRIGAEGIVSKQVDSSYRSGPHPAWVKTKNPASIAVQRERSQNWNR